MLRRSIDVSLTLGQGVFYEEQMGRGYPRGQGEAIRPE